MKNLTLLFLVALILRISFAILFQFDGLYGQDPFAYFQYTIDLRQALTSGQPPPPFFWPIGYPLLAVLASLVTGLRPLAGQTISILAGSLVAPLVYLLVLEIEPKAKEGGLVAGLLIGTAAQMMLSSLSYMADAAALAWATISALAVLRYLRTNGSGWLVGAAFTLGLAVITRWVYLLTVVPWGLAVLLQWRSSKIPLSRQLRLALITIAGAGLVVGCQLLLTIGQENLTYLGNFELLSWNPANAFSRTVTFADGTFTYERPVGLFYAMTVFHPAFVFPLLTPFLFLGLWSFRKRPLSKTTLVLGWPFIMFLFLVGTWENPRFSLVFFPPLAVLTSLGIQLVWQQPLALIIPKAAAGLTKFAPFYRFLLTLYLAIAIMGSFVWAGRDLRNFSAANNAQIAAARWLESQIPSEARVVSFGVTLTIQHRTGLNVSDIYLLDPDTLSDMLGSDMPFYLYLDLDNINGQWQGLSPHENYLWLQENSRLDEIGQHPPYKLFEVTAVP